MRRRWLLRASLGLNALVVLAAATLVAVGPNRIAAWVLRPARERLVSFFAANPIGAGEIVFLGDSLTDGARWDELFPGARVRNRGVPADTTADVLARLDQVAGAKPAKVFLMIGTNDLGRGASVAETATRYREILARLGRESSGTRLYVQSVLPRGAAFRAD